MILVDWTRMGRTYCLAGVISDRGTFRVVRPLLTRYRDAPVRNVGWSPWLLDGHSRWERFELVGPEPAAAEPPHCEDLWVRTLRPCRQGVAPEQRRAILTATMAQPGEPAFGAPLVGTRTAAYLEAGRGRRSLATLMVPQQRLAFTACRRDGAPGADFRVRLPIPDLGERVLPVKDHHLLARAESAAGTLQGQIEVLGEAVRQMGEQVVVRLGLSRPFQAAAGQGPAVCWLMADGFFSLSEPQP